MNSIKVVTELRFKHENGGKMLASASALVVSRRMGMCCSHFSLAQLVLVSCGDCECDIKEVHFLTQHAGFSPIEGVLEQHPLPLAVRIIEQMLIL